MIKPDTAATVTYADTIACVDGPIQLVAEIRHDVKLTDTGARRVRIGPLDLSYRDAHNLAAQLLVAVGTLHAGIQRQVTL